MSDPPGLAGAVVGFSCFVFYSTLLFAIDTNFEVSNPKERKEEEIIVLNNNLQQHYLEQASVVYNLQTR